VGGRNTNWVLPYRLIIVERKKGFEEPCAAVSGAVSSSIH